MRDPERIPRMLEQLGRLWTAVPDMRLGQLIDNVTYTFRSDTGIDLFNTEDDVTEEGIAHYLEMYANRRQK